MFCLIFIYWPNLRRVIGISGSLIWSKTLMELIVNPCGQFRWSLEAPVSQIHCPHLLVGASGIFSEFFKVCSEAKEKEWGAESNRKLLHLFIPSKTATLVPEFAVENLPLGITAVTVPEFAVKDLSLGTTPCWWWLYVGYWNTANVLNFINQIIKIVMKGGKIIN